MWTMAAALGRIGEAANVIRVSDGSVGLGIERELREGHLKRENKVERIGTLFGLRGKV